MSTLRYWTGTRWELISTGGGGDGGGVPGPPGADGQSVEVFGPQPAQPAPYRKGDVWLYDGPLTRSEVEPAESLSDPPEPIVLPLRS